MFSYRQRYLVAVGKVKKIMEYRVFGRDRLSILGFEPGPVDGVAGDRSRGAAIEFINFIKPQEDKISGSDLLRHLRLAQKGLERKKILNLTKSVQRPENGGIYYANGEKEIAPLEIRIPDQGYDFLIKLTRSTDGMPVKAFYMRSGSTYQTKIPLGSYEIKYTLGHRWYGITCLFRFTALYNKANKVFDFSRKGGQVTGFSVELILQVDGGYK